MKKVVVFVPAPEADRVRDAIMLSGAGKLGNYSSSVNHSVGTYHQASRAVDEERIEFACDDDTYATVVRAVAGASRYAAVDSWNMDVLKG